MIRKTQLVAFLTLLFILSNCSLVVCQDDGKTKMLQVRSGVHYFLLNDEIASNLNYSGSSFNIGASLLNADDNKRNHYNLTLVFPRLTSLLENEMNGILGEFNYQHLRKIKAKNLRGNLAVGGFAKIKSFVRTFTILNERTSGEIYSSFGPSFCWDKPIANRHSLRLQVQSPFIAYVFDFDSFVSTKEGLVTVVDFVDYDFDFQYEFSAYTKASFYLHYHFNYYKIKRAIAPVQYGSSQFLVGLNIRL